MVNRPTPEEYDELNLYLNTVLENYREGRCSLSQARGTLAEVIELGIQGAPNVRFAIRAHTQQAARNA